MLRQIVHGALGRDYLHVVTGVRQVLEHDARSHRVPHAFTDDAVQYLHGGKSMSLTTKTTTFSSLEFRAR